MIPVRNGAPVLAQCLEAVTHQSLRPSDYEIIVIDDGSSDDTRRIALEYGVRLVSQASSGTAAARNRGVEKAGGAIVLFTDADCVPDRRWAETLSHPLLEGRIAGVVGRCFSKQTQWVAGLTQIELDERYAKMGKHQQVDFLNTGNCGFRKDILAENPFDADFHWLEDVELSFRLSHRQHSLRFVPTAQVYHPHPDRFWHYLRRKFRYAS